MDAIDATEFPFVEQLPKREVKKVCGVWDLIKSYRDNYATDGILLPVSISAQALNVSKQRVHQLVETGRLKIRYINGSAFITENSLLECAETARKIGRPFKTGATVATLKFANKK
jgi:hypothetical protein